MEDPAAAVTPKESTIAEETIEAPPVVHRLYTLKFNSPILPYAKFPLTQNKYIQDFLRKYEEDKELATHILGVHFPDNNNSNATDAVGIEIEISKKNNITVVESNSNKRFKINTYDELSNFCMATEYEDKPQTAAGGKPLSSEKFKDLLNSELYELKNLWYQYNKKINSVLAILPQEVVTRYDMIQKTLSAPVFDVTRYPEEEKDLNLIFDEITYKLAQYYFSVY
jgi:hypothetical protein